MPMNHYGEMARQHWAKYRPVEYQAMTGREEFFRNLGEQISDQIADLTPDLEGEAPAGETFPAKLGRLNWARLTAQEQVLRETLPPAEGDEIS
jgi:hypothetical protein